jgi:hypothetical protein
MPWKFDLITCDIVFVVSADEPISANVSMGDRTSGGTLDSGERIDDDSQYELGSRL